MFDTAAPSLANSFFRGAMTPAFREDPYSSFQTLLDRFGQIELAGTPVRRPTFTLRGLESLPVALAA